ncbi:MAG: 6-phosphofructokinase [Anaerolineae bacterium]|jgi:6-phosphofructokinase 1|nr:6-phosphofructokinase [Anaerolineae bacterium]
MVKKIVGLLTSGGDCPGLNAAIRGVGKAASSLDIQVIGYLDGFRGLVENRFIRLDSSRLSGILTLGGTILGTSRDKPHQMPAGELGTIDMRPFAVANYKQQHLDCLVCLGGGGTAKNARRLMKEGLDVITLPKTIDNDVWGTDVTFGFDTAMAIATEAIDRLHSTAESHHRVIVVEIMGHNAGWLALGAGVAGGADVILLPEIPYDIEKVAEAVLHRSYAGKRFSIIAMSEGAMEKSQAEAVGADLTRDDADDSDLPAYTESVSMVLARQLEELTRLESRVTSLGHLQRGGAPTPTDRLLATRLGTACATFIERGMYGVMVGVRGEKCVPVPLDEVAGRRKVVPLDHPWLEAARLVGTSFGD